jgi:uncharacterized protein YbcC (UPF0753/DUF2309 family)
VLRLVAVIDAPQSAIDRIISRHEGLAGLVENGWIQIHALDAEGEIWRRRGQASWLKVDDTTGQCENQTQSEAA